MRLRNTLSAALHRWLGNWPRRSPVDGLGEMRLFSLADLPLMLALSPRIYTETARTLAAFRRNLTDRRWAGLQGVYSRDYMWGYAYLLFFWARYCGALPQVIEYPDRMLPAEMFLRYVCEIDNFIDDADTRAFWHGSPERLKLVPRAKVVLDELLQRLIRSSATPQSCRAVAALIADFRQRSFSVIVHPDAAHDGPQPAIIRHKEATVGRLMRTWSLILARSYQVEEGLAQRASDVIFDAGMALQVIDDLSDAVVDYREGVANLFLGVVRERPDDWRLLCAQLGQSDDAYLSWLWVRQNIPRSYAAAIALRESYLDRLLGQGQAPGSSRTAELLDEIIHVIRRLGYVNS